ncbi:hypothetical protein FACS1894163_05910 [Spirochaetia bacterium]|nr:hypothetical protein FACS1894163_05910 [Spirochaetia bacterium]
MSPTQVTVTWTFYMLSLLRKRLGLAWEDFDKLQGQYNLSAFLYQQYELLHYYDNDYIINDTLKYITEQGGNINDLRRS